jgi:hypothetical protein
MSNVDPRQQELVEWLREEGHTPLEIERILAKVAEYDARMLHESIFDSINRGNFDVGTIIREALGEEETQ